MKRNVVKIRSALLIAGVCLLYISMIGPSPILSFVGSEYDLFDNNAALVLTVSIIYPVSAVASLVGGLLQERLGLIRMYRIFMAIYVLSGVVLLVCNNYFGLMTCRVLYAVAYGLSVPFIGAAIMDWYPPKQREIMSTLNGLFPWIGALACFLLASPLMELFASWQWSLVIWSVAAIPLLLLCFFVPKNEGVVVPAEHKGNSIGLYTSLLKRKEIVACVLMYVFDLGFYAYFSAVYPLFLSEGAGLSEQTANMLASLSFPLVGVVFAVFGGTLASRLGRRKPILLWGQMLKFAGIILAMVTIRVSLPLCLLGVGIFTVGNSMYLPAMYMVPMDLPKMDSVQVGASFSLTIAAGNLLGGTFMPVIGGKLTDFFVARSAMADAVQAHFFGLSRSILIVNVANLVCFLVVLFLMGETGPKGRKNA